MSTWKHLTIIINPQTAPYRASAWVAYSQEDNCYIAICPAFKHVSTHGDTEIEALNELRIALVGVLETYQEEGWGCPTRI